MYVFPVWQLPFKIELSSDKPVVIELTTEKQCTLQRSQTYIAHRIYVY